MQERQFRLTAGDGHVIFSVEWLPERGDVRGAVHIRHGMAEHCLRYRDFARYLTECGLAVFAHDHRGHGNSVGPAEVRGHYADQHGWDLVLQDVLLVNREIVRLLPGKPIVLFGHSMGSFIARGYSVRHANTLDGLIVSATGIRYGAIAGLARSIARWDPRRIGARCPSKLMATLAMGTFNLQFFPTRTKADWLSRDTHQVDAYVTDPLCGYDCSAQLWADLFGGIIEFERREARGEGLPAHLPALLVAGTRDPVSMGGRGIKQLAQRYRTAGLRDVDVKLYKGGRHELLNETNRLEVYADIGAWLERRISPAIRPTPGQGMQAGTVEAHELSQNDVKSRRLQARLCFVVASAYASCSQCKADNSIRVSVLVGFGARLHWRTGKVDPHPTDKTLDIHE
jgi:alpha-beta hydrolase superfamily lysophospholipase